MVVSDQRSPQTCSWSYPEMFLLVVLHLLIVSVGGSPGVGPSPQHPRPPAAFIVEPGCYILA